MEWGSAAIGLDGLCLALLLLAVNDDEYAFRLTLMQDPRVNYSGRFLCAPHNACH